MQLSSQKQQIIYLTCFDKEAFFYIKLVLISTKKEISHENSIFNGWNRVYRKAISRRISERGCEDSSLVRSKSKATRIFQEIGILKEGVMHFVEGDLTKVDLGLSAEDQERVLKTDVIIHAGGPMDIQATSKEAASVF